MCRAGGGQGRRDAGERGSLLPRGPHKASFTTRGTNTGSSKSLKFRARTWTRWRGRETETGRGSPDEPTAGEASRGAAGASPAISGPGSRKHGEPVTSA